MHHLLAAFNLEAVEAIALVWFEFLSDFGLHLSKPSDLINWLGSYSTLWDPSKGYAG